MSQISGVDFSVSNLIEDSPASINIDDVVPQKCYACGYKTTGTLEWETMFWLRIMMLNSCTLKNQLQSFFWPCRGDVYWVPAENLICDVNPLEASTSGWFYVFEEVNFLGLFLISMFFKDFFCC